MSDQLKEQILKILLTTPPYIPLKKYVDLTGQTVPAVRQQISNTGWPPTKSRKSNDEMIYINLGALWKESLSAKY